MIFCVAGAGSEVRDLVVVAARGAVDVRVAVLVVRAGEPNMGAVAMVPAVEVQVFKVPRELADTRFDNAQLTW